MTSATMRNPRVIIPIERALLVQGLRGQSGPRHVENTSSEIGFHRGTAFLIATSSDTNERM